MLHNPNPGSGPFPTGDRTLAVLPSERKMAEARGHAPLPASAGRSGFKPVPILDRFDSLRSPSGSTSGRSISASLRRLQWSPRQAQHATHAERRTEGAGRSPEFRVAKRVNRTCVDPFRRRMPDQLFAVQPCWAPARLTPHPLRGVGAAPSPRCSAPSATRRNGPRARTPTGNRSFEASHDVSFTTRGWKMVPLPGLAPGIQPSHGCVMCFFTTGRKAEPACTGPAN